MSDSNQQGFDKRLCPGVDALVLNNRIATWFYVAADTPASGLISTKEATCQTPTDFMKKSCVARPIILIR